MAAVRGAVTLFELRFHLLFLDLGGSHAGDSTSLSTELVNFSLRINNFWLPTDISGGDGLTCLDIF